MVERGKIDVRLRDIRISSCFDSGNLDRVVQCRTKFEYKLWTAPDCAGTNYESSNRTWFYFSVDIPNNYPSKILRFHIQNLNKQSRLYQQGMTPFYRIVPGRASWERIRTSVEWQMGSDGLVLTFEYVTRGSSSNTVYFAFCYPFSYTDCQNKLNLLDHKYGLGKTFVYYHRELICYSLEGRRVELLTISSLKGITQSREPRLEGLFPDTATPRAHHFIGKKVVLFSSRVHPGETPASHVFNGLLDFLLREDDERSESVRNNFVVKMIPMLNPDGVSCGYYRTDTRGVNLNRVYLNPDPQLHPSIFAAKSIMLYHHKWGFEGEQERSSSDIASCDLHACSSVPTVNHQKRGGSAKVQFQSASMHFQHSRSYTYPIEKSNMQIRFLKENHGASCPCQYGISKQHCKQSSGKSGVALYVDLHAHATKRGCFFYGNFLKDEEQQVENMLYPRLVAHNSPHVDFEQCLFSEKNMHSIDKRDGTSKEGSGRVALHKATGLIHSYTLECNYNSGRQSNAVSSATCDSTRASPPVPHSPLPSRYFINSYEQVGRALATALLDLHCLNPWSRLLTSELGSLEALRSTLAIRIKTSRAKAQVNNAQCSLPQFKVPVTCNDVHVMRTTVPASPMLLSSQRSPEKYTKRAPNVSRLTKRSPVDTSKPYIRQLHTGAERSYKVARAQNVIFPPSDMRIPTAIPAVTDSYRPSISLPKKQSKAMCLLPKRASGGKEPFDTRRYMTNRAASSVGPPSQERTISRHALPPS